MTIHQKALEILSYCSKQKYLRESDPISLLDNNDYIDVLNELYETEIHEVDIRHCRSISSLIDVWERKTSLPYNIQSAKLQRKIDAMAFPSKSNDKKSDQVQPRDPSMSVVHIEIVKPINLYSFIVIFVIIFFVSALYLYTDFWMSISVLGSILMQLFFLTIKFDIPFEFGDLSLHTIVEFFEGLSNISIPHEKLIVSYSDLKVYYNQQKNLAKRLLYITIAIIIGNLFPIFVFSDSFVNLLGSERIGDGSLFAVFLAIFIIIVQIYVIGCYIVDYFNSSKDIKKKICTIDKLIKEYKQANLAMTYELSSKTKINSDTDKILYVIFDERSHNEVYKIINELNLYLSNQVIIVTPDKNDTNDIREKLIEDSAVVLCLIDNNFVNSLKSMHELICASNLNKTIIAGCFPNTDLPSNIRQYIRREIHPLEAISAYNSLVLELLPLFGCSDPFADAVGEHYELHVNSCNPYIVSFDDKNYNFSSSQTIHLFFASGSHNILIYNTKDIMVKRMVNITDCSTLSKKSHYVDRIDLDGIFIERK